MKLYLVVYKDHQGEILIDGIYSSKERAYWRRLELGLEGFSTATHIINKNKPENFNIGDLCFSLEKINVERKKEILEWYRDKFLRKKFPLKTKYDY